MQVNWIKRALDFVGSTLAYLCILIAVVILGYMVYLWGDILKNLSFLELAISIGLFIITIPIAPIYIGIHGDWGPAIYILLGFLILCLSIVVCSAFYTYLLFVSSPERK